MMSLQAVHALVAQLNLSNDSPTSRTKAVHALAAVASEDEASARAVVEAGALPHLVTLLRTGAAADKASAAAVLHMLARHNTLRAIVVETGAILPLVALLHAGSDEGRASAAGALAKLALRNDAYRDAIVAAGALPSVVALLHVGNDVGKTRAAEVLGSLARGNSEIKRAIVAADALPRLVEALLRFPGSDEGKARAAGALYSLAHENAEHAVLVVAAGALPPIVMLLRTGTVEGKAEAAGVLASIAHVPLLRRPALDCGAAGALSAAIDVAEHGTTDLHQHWLLRDARIALQLLCPDQDALRREVSALQFKLSAAEQTVDRLQHVLEGLASLVCAPTTDSAHDVVFRTADGAELGGSRLLLSHASPSLKALLAKPVRRMRSDVINLDPTIPLAAHEGLLRQLHAQGEVALPANLDALLMLLRAAAKVRSARRSDADADAVVSRVLARGEAAVRTALSASNCLDVILALASDGAFDALVNTAQDVAIANEAAVVRLEKWHDFRSHFPERACAVMDSAVKVVRHLRHAQDSVASGVGKRVCKSEGGGSAAA
jgi:ParB-like chromosome segregation protein Spo0J